MVDAIILDLYMPKVNGMAPPYPFRFICGVGSGAVFLLIHHRFSFITF